MEKALRDSLALEYTAKLTNFGYSVTPEYVQSVIDTAKENRPAGGPPMFIHKWLKEAGYKS